MVLRRSWDCLDTVAGASQDCLGMVVVSFIVGEYWEYVGNMRWDGLFSGIVSHFRMVSDTILTKKARKKFTVGRSETVVVLDSPWDCPATVLGWSNQKVFKSASFSTKYV